MGTVALRDLANPQYSAITGGRRKKLPLEAVIEAQVPPAIAAGEREADTAQEQERIDEDARLKRESMTLQDKLAQARETGETERQTLSLAESARQFNDKMALDTYALNEAGEQADKAADISLAQTIISGGKVMNDLGIIDKVKNMGAETFAGSTAAPEYVAPPAIRAISEDAIGFGYGEEAEAALTSAAEDAHAMDTLGTVASYGLKAFVAPAGIGFSAGKAGTAVTGSKTAGAISGGLIGGIVGFVMGGPIGAVIGAGAGIAGSRCIIVTACTDRYSYEVEVARAFRDNHMSAVQLLGYYRLADRLVPWIERSERVKKIVKKGLVDQLVDYGEWYMGYKPDRRHAASRVITLGFLKLCTRMGGGSKREEACYDAY